MGKEVTEDQIVETVREWSTRGRPENGAQLRALYDAGEEIPSHLLDFNAVAPQKPAFGNIEIPPLEGKGSGVNAWREFANEASDLDESVVEKMTKDEIVEYVRDAGIIPAEEEEADGEEG